jgi:hypothetical protein
LRGNCGYRDDTRIVFCNGFKIMKKLVIFIHVIILIVLVSIFSKVIIPVALNSNVTKPRINTPSESERKKWEEIENILLEKDSKTVSEIDKLLSEQVKEENNVTSLLEQKASTQIGTISIIITIILAVSSFYTKDLSKYLLKKGSICISVIFIISMFFLLTSFFCTIYFDYQGFKIREEFAAYNINDLFDIMRDKSDKLATFQISNILENYQICGINSDVNEAKAIALNWAAKFFIFCIIWSFETLLIIVCIVSSNSIPRKEVT